MKKLSNTAQEAIGSTYFLNGTIFDHIGAISLLNIQDRDAFLTRLPNEELYHDRFLSWAISKIKRD